eukprot:261762-Amphidinium_carterae.1
MGHALSSACVSGTSIPLLSAQWHSLTTGANTDPAVAVSGLELMSDFFMAHRVETKHLINSLDADVPKASHLESTCDVSESMPRLGGQCAAHCGRSVAGTQAPKGFILGRWVRKQFGSTRMYQKADAGEEDEEHFADEEQDPQDMPG